MQEARLLKRTLTWDHAGILWEADPKHVDIILEKTGVTRGVTTPLTKEKVDPEEEEEVDEFLGKSTCL